MAFEILVHLEEAGANTRLIVEEVPHIGPLNKQAMATATDQDLQPLPHGREFFLSAVAAWSELLGIDDVGETIEAMIHVQDHGEPEPDPETGENVWTDAYTLLTLREQSREQEAIKALEEGTQDDPRSPELRGALAAFNAVHQPIDGGECAMDRCRRVMRDRLGIVKEPTKKTAATSRLVSHKVNVTFDEVPPVKSLLEPMGPEIDFFRREFLHSLTGHDNNPLRDTTPPQAEMTVEEADPFAATMRKYGAK